MTDSDLSPSASAPTDVAPLAASAGEQRSSADDLRAASKLAVAATAAVTAAVEAIHHAVLSGPGLLGKPLAPVAKLFTHLAYGHVRRVTRIVGFGVDAALAQLAPVLGQYAPGPARDAAVAALNGVVGDILRDTSNVLAIEMRLRRNGEALAFTADALRALPDLGPKPLILIHGSAMSDRQWLRNGHDHGAALARDLGYTPLYLHYNSGLHISTNGRQLASLLDQLAAAWPVPLDGLSLVGFSMGGLVARGACHVAEAAQSPWRSKLTKLVCVGTPHHGAPLERGGSWLEALFGVSRFSAPLGPLAQVRSAGVTDLRYGLVLDEHWRDRDRFALGNDPRTALRLPSGVDCYALAGTTVAAAADLAKLPGDGIVPVRSALGQHPTLDLAFPVAHQHVAHATNHLALLEQPVYDVIRNWLTT